MNEIHALRAFIDQAIPVIDPHHAAVVADIVRRTCDDAPYILDVLGLEAA